MKRDWNLIKELLLRIECQERGHHFVEQALAQHCCHSVKEHLRFMHHISLIEYPLDQVGESEAEVAVHSLTPQGRDLLNAMRASDSRHYSLLHHSSRHTREASPGQRHEGCASFTFDP
jgi:hypothetical protein